MHWIEWKPKECKDTKEWCAYSVDCTEDFVKSACPKKCKICTGNFRGKNIDPIKFLNHYNISWRKSLTYANNYRYMLGQRGIL